MRFHRGPRPLPWVYDDGGRTAAGFEPAPGDCVARAITIATGRWYGEVHAALNMVAEDFRGPKLTGRWRPADDGIYRHEHDTLLLGVYHWQWTPTMSIGSGCRFHLAVGELPDGPVIARVSKHLTAIIDGVVHDTSDPTRGGTRCVYGFYTPKQETP